MKNLPVELPFLFRIVLLMATLTLVAGCAHCPLCGAEWGATRNPPVRVLTPEIKTVSGSVSCLERVTVLPTFELKIKLVSLGSDGSILDVVAEQVVKSFAEFPVRFSFEYDSAKLSKSGTYGLAAELVSQGATLFKTDTQYKVLPDVTAPPVDLVIVRSK